MANSNRKKARKLQVAKKANAAALRKCRLISVLMWTETLNFVTLPDMRSLMARTGGMSSWILTEISSTEDNSVKQFCLQKFCRLFFRKFFFSPKNPAYYV